METHPGEGVVRKFPHSWKPSHRQVCGGFWNFKRATKLGEKKKNPQNTCLTTTASGEVAQTLESATSELGLGREAQAASCACTLHLTNKVRPRPECPEDS